MSWGGARACFLSSCAWGSSTVPGEAQSSNGEDGCPLLWGEGSAAGKCPPTAARLLRPAAPGAARRPMRVLDYRACPSPRRLRLRNIRNLPDMTGHFSARAQPWPVRATDQSAWRRSSCHKITVTPHRDHLPRACNGPSRASGLVSTQRSLSTHREGVQAQRDNTPQLTQPAHPGVGTRAPVCLESSCSWGDRREERRACPLAFFIVNTSLPHLSLR